MTHDTSDREIVISRVINAPRTRVWQAWADPQQLIKWWGPNGFTNTFESMDFRTGGVWKFIMHGPNGVDYPNTIVFTNIVENERIAYDHSGDETEAMFQSVITLEDEGGRKTKVTLRAVFATAEERNKAGAEFGAVEGGKQTLGRLAALVESSQ